jgi:Xaa-Pro dipeptidase
MNLAAIQEELQKQKLDGWLFFDHHRRDPLAYRVLGFQPASHVTRRWYYWIPAAGEPRGLVHRIESGRLDTLPGDKIRYSSWSEQTGGLRALVGGARRVAMQYSPMCAIPYVAMVDAGTVELVRSLGVEVVSSAELIQHFEARWTAEALESHLEAGRRVDRVRAQAFEMIREITRGGGAVQEFAVAEFVRDGFAKAGLFAEDGPIVGVNANAANPHYEPSAEITSEIRSGDLVLLDMWAKLNQPGAVYYDITWTGFCGDRPSDEMLKVYGVVAGARDAAIAACATRWRRARSCAASKWTTPRADTSPAAATATTSCIAPAIRSARKCTATARIWTTWRPTTSAASCPGPASPSSRAFI